MMKRALLALFALGLPMTAATAQYYGSGSNPNDHAVSGYTNDRGTYVAPHYQTNPNHDASDNYGARGNYNPHNGQGGRGY